MIDTVDFNALTNIKSFIISVDLGMLLNREYSQNG